MSHWEKQPAKFRVTWETNDNPSYEDPEWTKHTEDFEDEVQARMFAMQKVLQIKETGIYSQGNIRNVEIFEDRTFSLCIGKPTKESVMRDLTPVRQYVPEPEVPPDFSSAPPPKAFKEPPVSSIDDDIPF